MRRAQRLRHRQEFAAVYRRGRPYRNELLVLRALRTDGLVTRVGFTARKALGKAVVRNRTKRRLREAVRSMPLQRGWDVVINAREGAQTVDYWRLREAANQLLGRAGVLAREAAGT